MVPKSINLKSWSELKGKSACGVQGAYYNYEAAMDFKLKVTAFAAPTEALTALKEGHCAGLLYDDASIGDVLEPEWSDYEMSLESREFSLGLRAKGQPEWAAYLSTMVKTWARYGDDRGPRDQVSNQTLKVRRRCHT